MQEPRGEATLVCLAPPAHTLRLPVRSNNAEPGRTWLNLVNLADIPLTSRKLPARISPLGGENMAEVKKLVCNIDSDLLAQVDAYAATLHVNRTAAVSVLISTALKQEHMMNDFRRLLDLVDAEKAQQA